MCYITSQAIQSSSSLFNDGLTEKKGGRKIEMINFFTIWMITIGSNLVLDRLKGPDQHKL